MKTVRINTYRFVGGRNGINGSSWAKDATCLMDYDSHSSGLVLRDDGWAALHHAIYGDNSGLRMKFYQYLYGHSEYFVTDESKLTI